MGCAVLVVEQLYVTIPLVGDLANRFAVDPERAAWVGTAFGVAYAAGFLVFGPLSDRIGRHRVILAGLGGTAAATLLVGVAPTFGLLLVARAVQGFAASAFPPAALSLVSEDLPPPMRPSGVSLMSAAFLGAAPLAQAFAGVVGDLPITMTALAPLYLIGGLSLALMMRRNRQRERATGGASQQASLAMLIRIPALGAAWAAAATVLFGFVAFHAGAQALGAGVSGDLQALRLIGLPPLLLTLVAAPLTARAGATVTARLGLGVAALGLMLAATGEPVAVMAASVLLSGGIALAVPGLIATVAGQAPAAHRGLAMALYSVCLFLGASAAPPFAQALADLGPAALWLGPAGLMGAAIAGLTWLGPCRRPAPLTP